MYHAPFNTRLNRVFTMRFKLLLALTILLSATACAPYKMDIRQGNYISQESREKLKTGMTRLQVRSLLGSPLVTDTFHPDRWDYVYSYEHRRTQEVSQHLTLYFEGDKLVRIDDSGMSKGEQRP